MPGVAKGLDSIHSAEIEHVVRVWLRDGTSDSNVFNQIFQTEEFNISTAPQFAWVRAAYDRTLGGGCGRWPLRHSTRYRHGWVRARAGELLWSLRYPPDARPLATRWHAAPGAVVGHDRLVRA